MAKRKQDDTQELPPVTVETVQIVPVEDAPAIFMDGDVEQCHIYNPDSGEYRLLTTRLGYARAAMPNGFRVANLSELPKEG